MAKIERSISFDEKKHEYTLEDGAPVPSVTHVLRFMNVDVAANADRFMRDQAAERGRRIHEACLLVDYMGDDIAVDAQIAPYVRAYVAFLNDHRPDWLLSEYQVLGEINVDPIHRGMLYAGTVDRYGKIDEELVVLDIKTGTFRNFRYFIAQSAAYASALIDNGYSVDKIGYLILKSDGTYRLSVMPYNGIAAFQGMRAFRACYELQICMEEE